jgi:CheY-like chemotaxis protein
MLARLLQREGYDTTIHTCGDDLLQRIGEFPPELIILDYNMPGLNGLDCLRRIRDRGNWTAVPVILHTADSSFKLRNEAFAAGAQDFIIKGTLDWCEMLRIIVHHAGAPVILIPAAPLPRTTTGPQSQHL